jgi:predicted metal-dependent HD superfamily phosphohydrolase
MKGQPGRYGIEDTISGVTRRPEYWKTVSRLRADRSRLELNGAALHFSDYAFEPASVFPSGKIAADEIAEVNLGSSSQVRLRSGEILFVGSADKELLVKYINQHDVLVKHRHSVWSDLLDPFVDTWYEQEVIDRQFERLAALGLDRESVTRWRREVAPAMIGFNFGAMVWDWCSLDLHDALVAQRACLGPEAFADFYRRAMAIAALDPESNSPWGSNPSKSLDSAVFSVLLEWWPREPKSAKAVSTVTGRMATALLGWVRRLKASTKSFAESSKERFERVKVRQGALVAELAAAYSLPHRHYHTLAHIEHCIGELNGVWWHAVHLNELKWALIFHDAVYDPTRDDNEARSADWACGIMTELGRPEEEQLRVRELIMATAHTAEPHTADKALMCDVDLSILAADEGAFDEYDRAIRAEYEFVPESRYREARAEILESFLRRERLFHTALYRRYREARARANLERALARLHQHGV